MRNRLGRGAEIAEPGSREPQGVGSRPFVSEIAARLGPTGGVRNESQGAVVKVR